MMSMELLAGYSHERPSGRHNPGGGLLTFSVT